MREEERRAAAAHDAGRETAQVGGEPDPAHEANERGKLQTAQPRRIQPAARGK